MGKTALDRRPIFSDMTEEAVQDYLQIYIKEKFKPNSRFMIKVPEHEKDDALNEIFIDLWRNRDNYNPQIADYTTYAYNRGRHVIKNIISGCTKNKRIRDRYTELPKGNKHIPSGFEIAEKQDLYDNILGKMSKEEKEIVEMRFFEEKTVNEIAEEKDCSPQKIYQIISGLKRLSDN